MAGRALLLLAVAALGACGGGGPASAARPSATPTSSVTAPASAPGATGTPGAPGAQPDRCHTAGLALSALGQPNGGAGNFVQEFGLTNRAGVSCWVYGYPGMALIDAAGNQLPTRVIRDPGSRFAFAHVARYTVRPGATAPFWVHWEDVPVGTQPACTTSAGLIVTPPDETTQLRLDGVPIMACNGGELDVSPVTAPGTTGPM